MQINKNIMPLKYYIFVSFLITIGLIFSLILSYNYFSAFDPNIKTINWFCPTEGYFNCANVSQGKYSTIWGFPISLMGLGFYFVVILYYLLPNLNTKKINHLSIPFLFILILANLVDLILLGISIFVIGNLCFQCIMLYLVNLFLLIIMYNYELKNLKLKSDLKKFFKLLSYDNSLQKEIAIFGMINLLFFIALSFWSSNKKLTSTFKRFSLNQNYFKEQIETIEKKYYQQPTLKINTKGAPFVGFKKAPIKIVVFHDLQCPHCQKSFIQLEKLIKPYENLVKIIYMNYPIIDSNRISQLNSFQLAQYSMVAHEKNKYGYFLKELFKRFKKGRYIDKREIKDIFQNIKFDLNFKTIEKESLKWLEVIKKQKKLAKNLYQKSGQTEFGTPGIFLNGRFVMIGYSNKLINNLLIKEILNLAKKKLKIIKTP